jgi:integrase
MASVIPHGDTFRIGFTGIDRKRRTIYCGATSEQNAHGLRRLVERILEAAALGEALDPNTASRIAALPDTTYEKLVGVELVHPRKKAEAATLGAFLDKYIERRTDLKGATLVFYGHTVENLNRFFGDDKRLEEITPADADDFRRWLQGDDASRQNPNGKQAKRDAVKPLKRLAVTTVNRRCVAARTIFRDALRRKLVDENPFAGIAAGTKTNPERARYIKPETVASVLEACPHDEWRLLISLSRFAGLRIPSEALPMTWDDVNWAENRLTIRSPKTEHHEGKAQRTIPLFPEVRVYLDSLWSVAPEKATLVFSKLQRESQFSATGWKSVNLRTMFTKILRRAGVEPWPRLFHNMRASCQTDLEQRFPSYVVCQWMGNSETIAKAHYLQVLPEHFDGALERNVKCNARGAENGHNATQSNARKNEKTRISAGFSFRGMGDEGLEPPTSSL